MKIEWRRVQGYEKKDWWAYFPDCRIVISHRPVTGGPSPYHLKLYKKGKDGEEREYSSGQFRTLQQAKKGALDHLETYRKFG